MKQLLALILTFLTLSSFGQMAIIKDKDGYTNVRKEPNGNSEIIYKIKENKVFWYDFEPSADKGDWIPVFIPKNNFSFGCTKPSYIVGFIHKSRLLPLEDMETYKGTDLEFNYVFQPFDPTNRIIEKHEEKWVTAIDGRPVWGRDCGLPKTEIKKIIAKINGQKIEINRAFFSNLFECKNEFKIYKIREAYIIFQTNSDGAGYYELAWVITNEGLKQRLVGCIF